jgi:hypothetical protein
MVKGFKCEETGCARAYNASMGYFDFVNDQYRLLDQEQQDCHRGETRMLLERVEGYIEIWSCGQRDCDYTQNLKRQPQHQTNGANSGDGSGASSSSYARNVRWHHVQTTVRV